jgi:OFA family oxalate/formate antiporter-like MFS transporter
MVAVANLQYGWTLFVNPLATQLNATKTVIQVAFTLFILAETWLVPFEGYLVDRFGPRLLVAIGGILVGVAWILNANATTVATLYMAGVIGGIGAGIVYGTTIGNALKWFPDRRGLAAGLTAAAFGAGSALTIIPIANMIKVSGYQSAFFAFGLGQGLVVLLVSTVLRAPSRVDVPLYYPRALGVSTVQQSGRDFTPTEMLKTPAFWLLYLMFTMVATGGLMATAQLAPIAKDFKVADIPVSMFGFTLVALPFALSLDRILNGITRPFFGWVSDHIGRENTMFIAFGLEGTAIILLLRLAHVPLYFVLLTGLTFFAWGEIYSLFPAICGDLFGRKFATTNYGALYTAKGTASLLVPIGSLLKATTGSWAPIFVLAIIFDYMAALLALFVLKPLRIRWLSTVAQSPPAEQVPSPAP